MRQRPLGASSGTEAGPRLRLICRPPRRGGGGGERASLPHRLACSYPRFRGWWPRKGTGHARRVLPPPGWRGNHQRDKKLGPFLKRGDTYGNNQNMGFGNAWAVQFAFRIALGAIEMGTRKQNPRTLDIHQLHFSPSSLDGPQGDLQFGGTQRAMLSFNKLPRSGEGWSLDGLVGFQVT